MQTTNFENLTTAAQKKLLEDNRVLIVEQLMANGGGGYLTELDSLIKGLNMGERLTFWLEMAQDELITSHSLDNWVVVELTSFGREYYD